MSHAAGFPRKAPCPGCPFSTLPDAVRLEPERREHLARELTDDHVTFHCHQALDYSDPDTGPDTFGKPACAGAEALRWRDGYPSILARIAAQFGARRPDDYDTSAVPWPDLATWAAEAPNLGDTP